MGQSMPGSGELSNNTAVREHLDSKQYRRIHCMIRAKFDMMSQADSQEAKIRYYLNRVMPASHKDEAASLLEKLEIYRGMS